MRRRLCLTKLFQTINEIKTILSETTFQCLTVVIMKSVGNLTFLAQ